MYHIVWDIDFLTSMTSWKIKPVSNSEPKLIAPSSPPKKKRKTHQSAKESEIVTDEKCGLCPGCRRKPCSECSVCCTVDSGNSKLGFVTNFVY